MHSNLILATRPDRELKGMEEKKRSYPDIMGRKMKRISFFNYFPLLPFRNRGKNLLKTFLPPGGSARYAGYIGMCCCEEYGFRAVSSGIE